MIAVGMVEVTVDEVVDVVAVGDGLVATPGTVHVPRVVAFAGMSLRAFIGIGTGYGKLVLVVMVTVGMQEVAVLKVIHVPIVLDGYVATFLTVLVNVPAMGIAAHRYTPVSWDSVRNHCFISIIPDRIDLACYVFRKNCPQTAATRKTAACNRMIVAPLGILE